jgi:predicted permease
MSRLRAWCLRLAGFFDKERKDRELAEELDSHLQFHIEDNLRAGMTEAEARRNALMKLGGLAQTKENYRERRGFVFIESLLQDLRFGLRMLRKTPGVTAVVVVTLALGIGANTTIFTVVNSVLLLPLPFPNPDRLVTMWMILPPNYGIAKGAVSVPDLKDWQNQNQLFDGITAYQFGSFNLRGEENPERVVGAYVTPNFFDVMSLRPILGRGFLPSEDVKGRDHVAVLSYALWKAMFGEDLNAIGRTIRLNSETFDIVGVMPSEFGFPNTTIQLWAPLAPTPEQEAGRGAHFLQAVARMRPGVTEAAAQAEMDTIMNRMAQQHPEDAVDGGVRIEGLQESGVEDIRVSILILFAAVGLVFLIACDNVVNLLLVRVVGRTKEICIRAATGATRGRLLRQFFTESLLLALFGGLLGWFLALWGTELLGKIKPRNLQSIQDIRPDLHVLVFTLILSVVATLCMCLGMALQSSKPNLANNLKDSSLTTTSGRRRDLARRVLVIAQIATALVLMVGALLLIESLDRLLRVDPGVAPEHVLTMRIALPAVKYPPSRPEFMFYEPALENVERIPGVQAAGLISLLPIQSANSNSSFEIEGRPKPGLSNPAPFAELRAVSPGYFRSLGIPLIRGRYLTARDDEAGPLVAVINKTLAEQYFPNDDPIGKRLIFDGNFNVERPVNLQVSIVGISGNIRQFGLAEVPHPEVDICYLQFRSFGPLATKTFVQTMSLVVRTTGDPTAVAMPVQEAIQHVDPDQPVFNVTTMEDVITASVSSRRFNVLMLGTFASLGLILAVIGIYGVISYSVRQRVREIGVRMALGARKSDVLSTIIGSGMRLALTAIFVGLAGALALTRFLSSLLYGVSPTDPTTFLAVAVTLLTVSLMACYIPARRAARVDPIVALRHE